MSYPIHTAKTAPDAARDILAGAEKAYGFVPNLLRTALRLLDEVREGGTLSPQRRQRKRVSNSRLIRGVSRVRP